ncbi:MATE family efflux transporter DinF [Celerinatantimonas diazotrophica]|uniref:MATE family multidrug resistance protein n=1 Tax=Celerinatantimonas diazotrophica TaxID=412034 RepID=A0A4R1J884_9GAMM|nr:MATE family efflux transporter DinF [Celerinatantimonas diazotrophica]TCK46785.1 MATE family multidrug resistance protein [Celerinatantimonas diazotrophica]CAG9295488.1 DNA damage-inducible protein F [Celerinatantimonas diazotrophica]
MKLFDRQQLKAIFAIAIPMILSNITVPLLGLVDTAVVGHLSHSYYLGGVAVGATIISFLFWMAGFLRMSTTGTVAQAIGRNDNAHAIQTWRHSACMGLLIAAVLIVCQYPIWLFAAKLAGADPKVAEYAHVYYLIRIWGAPAALLNYATLGCLLGMKRAKIPMFLLIVTNVVNIALDLVLVMGLQLNVAGAASASLIADYTGALLGLWLLHRAWRNRGESLLPNHWLGFLRWSQFNELLRLNRDIFLRTLSLQICFSFITFEGAKLGTVIVATNAVLMNFMMFASYALDGLAYAVEALAGDAVGRKDRQQFNQSVFATLSVALLISIAFAIIYQIFGEQIVALLTSIDAIRQSADKYLPWLVFMPIVAVWSYIFDGVYVALTKGNVMRNGMIISTFVIFFPVWWLTRSFGNHGLWFALCCFMLARGVTLIAHYWFYNKRWFARMTQIEHPNG